MVRDFADPAQGDTMRHHAGGHDAASCRGTRCGIMQGDTMRHHVP